MIRLAIHFVTMALVTCLATWLMVGCAASHILVEHTPTPPETGNNTVAVPTLPGTSAQLLPPQSLPSRDEEVWVIARPPEQRNPPHSDTPLPGEGRLFASQVDSGKQTLTPLPLTHTDVNASVMGYIASVDVKQQYNNPFASKIDALYVFPLPQNAAVDDFLMTVGSRRIRGIIRERHEAEQIYQQAKSQGYVASLLTQERPNVFTQAVANIEPGKRIDIEIQYFNTLAFADGGYEFVFPMVLGPRFTPPGFDPGGSGQIQAAKQRSGHDISLSVDLDAGVPISNLDSRNHKIRTQQIAPGRVRVTLDPQDSLSNRDFVLRYQVGGNAVKPAFFAQREGSRGYFTLMLYPPRDLGDLPRQPLEFVFTIDVSSSQAGAPLAQAKSATRYALTHMGPQDTFQVIRFGNTAEKLFPSPQPASPQAVRQALRWVNGFEAAESTMLIDGLHASLLFPHDPNRTRCVVFMTDGFVGNDAEALAETHRCLGPAHVFGLGVGQSINQYVLDGMARMGRGAVAYLGPNDDAQSVMAEYLERVSHPALTDISVDWKGGGLTDVFPRQVPDVYVGRPVILTGRFQGEPPREVTLHGAVDGRQEQIEVPVTCLTPADSKALPAIWAKMEIADLNDRASYDSSIDLSAQIRQIAMEYHLMSAYTAFVTVDSMTRTGVDRGKSVEVCVPPPQRVVETRSAH